MQDVGACDTWGEGEGGRKGPEETSGEEHSAVHAIAWVVEVPRWVRVPPYPLVVSPKPCPAPCCVLRRPPCQVPVHHLLTSAPSPPLPPPSAQCHPEHISQYGFGNEERLTGKHETCDMNTFRYGVGDRGSSIRIPLPVQLAGKGYLEDRRPSANVDPYV